MTSRTNRDAFKQEFEFFPEFQNAAQLIITPQDQRMKMKSITTFKIILNDPGTGEADIFYQTAQSIKERSEIPPIRILCEDIVYDPKVLMLKGINAEGTSVTIEIVY